VGQRQKPGQPWISVTTKTGTALDFGRQKPGQPWISVATKTGTALDFGGDKNRDSPGF
jgi:hypothetical protein